MLKAKENPPTIWPEEKSIRELMGTWWVAHTKSRNEKALAWSMAKKGISYFLPMSWKVSSHKGRKTRSLLPLFTGYLFFCGNENQRLDVLRTNRIANIIEVKDQMGLVEDLIPIEQALRAGTNLLTHQYIETGRRCQVTTGPLAGMEGIVVKDQANLRLVLQVNILGQATSVEIDSDMIELLD